MIEQTIGPQHPALGTLLNNLALVEIDQGQLDEAAWQRAVPAKDFVQQIPVNGSEPTERTEVRFLYTSDALYMGVTCYDDEPEKMLGNTMKRDEGLRADDRFIWIFDTFLDALAERTSKLPFQLFLPTEFDRIVQLRPGSKCDTRDPG